jgi:tetratricopeptide (TPR) repeat protein
MTARIPVWTKTVSRVFFGSLFAALLFTGFGVNDAAAQSDDQEYRRAFNAGLEAHQARDVNEAYRQFVRASRLAAEAGDQEVSRRAARVAAQLDYNIGNAMLRNERFEDALKRYDSGIELDATYPHNFIGKGSALRGLNRIDEAMATFVKGREVAQAANDQDMIERAHAGVRDHFVGVAAQALGRNDGNPRRSDADVAIGAITQMKEFVEPDADALFYMAVAHKVRGEFQQAVGMADAALEIHRGSRTDAAKIHFTRGEALMSLGDNEAAKAAFQNALFGDFRAPAQHFIDRL